MIDAPPSDAGAVHDRVTWASPALAVSPVGAPGSAVIRSELSVRGQCGRSGRPSTRHHYRPAQHYRGQERSCQRPTDPRARTPGAAERPRLVSAPAPGNILHIDQEARRCALIQPSVTKRDSAATRSRCQLGRSGGMRATITAMSSSQRPGTDVGKVSQMASKCSRSRASPSSQRRVAQAGSVIPWARSAQPPRPTAEGLGVALRTGSRIACIKSRHQGRRQAHHRMSMIQLTGMQRSA